jgi:predicted transcriptional regulator
MSKRVTIVLDDELVKKLGIIQAKKMKNSNQSISFSKVVNITLEKGLKLN